MSAPLRIPLFALFLLSFFLLATVAYAQQGTITGTVVDAAGASISGAQIKLSVDGAPDHDTRSDSAGRFAFDNLVPGAFHLSLSAKGFAQKTTAGQLTDRQQLILPPLALVIDTVATEINVTQTQTELAQAQIQVEEKQRLLGLVPDFFTSYDPDAAPLNVKQKIELTAKTWADPSSFVIGGIIAGVWQAENTHAGFGQGAQGYAKRYGASFADFGTMLLLEKVVTPTLFKQDPRYFYKGTGTKAARARYAISRAFVCRGDNRKDQVCYSSLIDRFGTGFITNYYYPAADRNKAGTIVQNAAISLGFEAVGNLFREFVARKITPRKRGRGASASGT